MPLGFGCNNACRFCAQGDLRERTGPSDHVLERLKAGREAGRVACGFVGGEPTLDGRLPELIREARALGYRSIAVQTNGRRLANAALTKELRAAGADILDISLAGPQAEIHDFHTRSPGSFKQTLRGISTAKAAGFRIGVTYVLTRSNFRHLTEAVGLMGHLRATAMLVSACAPLGYGARDMDALVPNPRMVFPHFETAAAAARKGGLHFLIAGVPLCNLPGLEGMALEWHLGDHRPTLTHPDTPCGACELKDACDGVEGWTLSRRADALGLTARGLEVGRAAQAQVRQRAKAAGLFCGPGFYLEAEPESSHRLSPAASAPAGA